MTMRVLASLIDAGRNEMEDPESVPHTTRGDSCRCGLRPDLLAGRAGMSRGVAGIGSAADVSRRDALFRYECCAS
jgi:hypothetical protein